MGGDELSKDYSLLSDFKLEIEVGKECNFCLSFWLYLITSNATTFPATLIKQVHSDVNGSTPFLLLNDKKTMLLFPSLFICKDTPDPGNSTALMEFSHASMGIEFPLENWVHVGCEVFANVLRLHINGEIAAEKPLSFPLDVGSLSNDLTKITLLGVDEDNNVQGYVYRANVLPLNFSIKENYFQDPPLHLSIDSSSTSEIEEESDGVWSIVGGKASCRRIFSVDVVLLNALGQTTDWQLEVAALLLYADNGLPVEKTSDDEAPLLTTYDGIEFASCAKPSKLKHGRSCFKLKISQLSSKCDNRLFKVKFEMPKLKGYNFLETFSHPIRCISRSRNPRSSSQTWKRPGFPLRESLQQFDDKSSETVCNSIQEITSRPSSKRLTSGMEKTSKIQRLNEECSSQAWNANQLERLHRSTLDRRPENHEGDNSSTDSENIEERVSNFRTSSIRAYSISDETIFKYCLGSLTDRAVLLKEVVISASEDELLKFAQEVSVYSGCSHHGHQIMTAKRLIEEGTEVWNSISRHSQIGHWETAMFEIEEQFMKISGCSTRSLTEQDFELLRRVAGCQEYMAQENFEKLWCWLYPIAFTISRECIKALWNSASPRWIEGFITKEEAELSLHGPNGFQQPGTFVLRFPTSRAWPHPDAGNLVVTYVGRDYTLHHRLLSLGHIYSSTENGTIVKPLQEMLLEEPELSRLGRIMRSQ